MSYTGKSYLDLAGLTKYDELIKEYIDNEVNTVSNLTGTTEPTIEQGGEGSMYFQTETAGETVKIKKTYVKTNGTWVELKMGGSGAISCSLRTKMGGSGVISCSLRTSVTVEKED